MKLKKLFGLLALLFMGLALTGSLTACGSDDDNPEEGNGSIVGYWTDGILQLIFDEDGSYEEQLYSTSGPHYGAERAGTYTYDPITSLLVINIESEPKNDYFEDAYQETYVVQTLSSKTLVLTDTEGNVKGRYHRE